MHTKAISMSTTVHLKLDDLVAIKPHRGLRSEAILQLSDSCDIFVTTENLKNIQKAIQEHFNSHSAHQEKSDEHRESHHH